MTILLGPCRCQGCGQRVYWAESRTRSIAVGRYTNGNGTVFKVTCWRDEDGRRHACPAWDVPAAKKPDGYATYWPLAGVVP